MSHQPLYSMYHQVNHLPFADGTFKDVPKIHKPIVFPLEKTKETVTLLPVNEVSDIPSLLVDVIHHEFNYVVEEGLTYPYHEPMDRPTFIANWFKHFVAILVKGDYGHMKLQDQDWSSEFLGTFYIKPNYVGRCSHVCNAGFMVNHEIRGLGLGKEMGRKYLEWAPILGYQYSVFNLVFETNEASLKIWDGLGFDRIGYVKNVAVLKGYDRLIGAVMYGKELQ